MLDRPHLSLHVFAELIVLCTWVARPTIDSSSTRALTVKLALVPGLCPWLLLGVTLMQDTETEHLLL